VTSAITGAEGRAVVRAGRHYLHTAIAVRRHPHASPAELKAFQDARLRQLLVHAYEHVPYYRKLFDRHRLHPRHIRGTVDLSLIPVSTKEDLRQPPPLDLIARGVDPGSLIPVRTSGTTGQPFLLRRTWLEESYAALFRARAFASFGLGLRARIAEVDVPRPIEYRNHKLMVRTIDSAGIHPSLSVDGAQPVDLTARQLEAFQPEMIVGRPGMLGRLADLLLAQGDHSVRPRILVTSGEVLTPLLRLRLTEAFGVEPLQAYTSQELQLAGWECRATNVIHVCDDGAIVEVLRDDLPVAPDEEGEVVATNLNAYAMPLIRYRLDDVVTRGPARCHCGQPFTTISAIQGRASDSFSLVDGRVVHPYHILKCFLPGIQGGIRQYQLVQERSDRIVLRVVPVGAVDPELEARMRKAVSPVLGAGIEFRVMMVDDILPDPSGRSRHALSLLSSKADLPPLAANA
jgi:phenylacetate-CoA ligase